MAEELASRKCVPCEGGTPALKGDALQRLLQQLTPGWNVVDGRKLEKGYKFKDFREALDFTNRVGELAEREGHHPDVYLGWGKVKLEISTHTVGGLTENDFILAAKVDQLKH